jgi:hypothetical protein
MKKISIFFWNLEGHFSFQRKEYCYRIFPFNILFSTFWRNFTPIKKTLEIINHWQNDQLKELVDV